MRYEWGTELLPGKYGVTTEWKVQHHLKKVWDKDPMGDNNPVTLYGTWKVTVAWVTKLGDRKWDCQFVNHNGSRTFRSLKAAKAYAVASIALDT